MPAPVDDLEAKTFMRTRTGPNQPSRWTLPVVVFALLANASATADQPAAHGLHTEFLMTLHAPLDPESQISDSLAIANVRPTGGWVQGPRLKGVLVPPGGDWSRVMPSGVLRLDVRLTIKADDGALIYVTYNGVERDLPVGEQKIQQDQHVIGPDDVKVWMIAPTFETSAAKYAWLNETQAVGKMVQYKDGPSGYVNYEIYAVR